MKEKNTTEAWWKPGILLFTKVSASTVVPIVFALVLGKYLDTKYNTTPLVFLSLTGLAFLVSLMTIWKHLTTYMKALEKEEDNKTH